jgi:glycerol-3-phosphate dehydrogenase (NAD(P)+)
VLTPTGELSPNRAVGLGLAGGRPLADVLAALGHVAEGVATAPVVVRRAEALGVEMPIAAAVLGVLEGRVAPADALAGLLARAARAEG